MVKDLIINAAILISFMSMLHLFFRDTEVTRFSPVKIRIVVGLVWGVVGIVLMVFSVRIAPSVIMDFRNTALILSGFFGGFVSLAITGIIIGGFRILNYGVATASIVANVVLFLLILGIGIISRYSLKLWKKWIYMQVYTIVLGCLGLWFVIQDQAPLTKVLLSYLLGNGFVSVFLYYYLKNLLRFENQYRRFKSEAATDFLTGLNNVRQFEHTFEKVIGEAKENNQPLSLLLIDVDFFKIINDSYGHSKGDEVLKRVSEVLRANCRNADLVSRVGGEEFALLLTHCDSTQAVEIAERIRATVASYPFYASTGERFEVTISIGSVTYYKSSYKMDDLRELADIALYKAKYSGRNKVVLAG